MKNLQTIQFGKDKINVKLINMVEKHVISPFHLACSHYNNKIVKYTSCDENKLGCDDRVCCSCDFYDGGKVIGLKWGDGITFQIYSFKKQYSLNQIKSIIKSKRLENL